MPVRVLIGNVRIVDGTGAGAKTGNVAGKDGRIVAVGEDVPAPSGAGYGDMFTLSKHRAMQYADYA